MGCKIKFMVIKYETSNLKRFIGKAISRAIHLFVQILAFIKFNIVLQQPFDKIEIRIYLESLFGDFSWQPFLDRGGKRGCGGNGHLHK